MSATAISTGTAPTSTTTTTMSGIRCGAAKIVVNGSDDARVANGANGAKGAALRFPDVKTIRDVIPPHCFVPSTWRSMSHLIKDYAIAGALMWTALHFIPQIDSYLYRAVAWQIYGFVQGLIATGIWILAHEAGHGAFSVHPLLNDFVGWVAHSTLLVPYFSWKYSHHRHHNFTGHMQKDMVFVPQTKEQYARDPIHWDLIDDVPIWNLIKLIGQQIGGFQLYLLFNVSAGSQSEQRKNTPLYRRSHFDGWSSVFRPQEALFILLSDLGLALVFGALWVASKYVGWGTVFLAYIVPYLWVHHWLVAITYLHHTHPDVPHYDQQNWTYVKGALATIDRDFGFIGRYLFHGIIDTHVVHHLFPRIPFYYQEEATEAIAKLLGPLYHRDDRPFLTQLWETFSTCKYVEQDPTDQGSLKWAKHPKKV